LFDTPKLFAFATFLSLLAVLASSPMRTVAADPTNQKTGVPGTYELILLADSLAGVQPIPPATLFVGNELILKAHVEDSFQSPALGGSVTFQVCSRQGGDRSSRWTLRRAASVTLKEPEPGYP
jgi:hypothetical protein